MNAYIPYRYNKITNTYDPELRVNFAKFILMEEESDDTVYSELKKIKTDIKDIYEKLDDFEKKLEEGISNTLIIQAGQPEGDARKVWINPDSGVAHYWNGEKWNPIAGTAV